MVERRLLRIEGVVQGVGFRPHVHRLAHDLELSGTVCNDMTGLVIEIEGDAERVRLFGERLLAGAPPLAAVTDWNSQPIPVTGVDGFVIRQSDQSGTRDTLIAPDVATCEACHRELTDPTDRRYRYPFINCSDCGPRFTIVRDTPYDRARTTMADFEMCAACRDEYCDPAGRRFHAEPIACEVCGPTLSCDDAAGHHPADRALEHAVNLLHAGAILAVKGLGGYHLVCDATSEDAVHRLRRRKARDAKPLAVMVRDVTVAARLAVVHAAERQILESRARPIVLLQKLDASGLAEGVAPGAATVGLMLPYTPLHALLLEAVDIPLVMTSGNLTDDPIAFDDDDARQRLGAIADGWLTHNRPIEAACDDSVVRVIDDTTVFIRRARGYAPAPVSLTTDITVPVLAVGGHLKNTFCLARGRRAFVSHHIGDLDHPLARLGLRTAVRHYRALFDIHPEIIAHDLHPDYGSTRVVETFGDVPAIPVQHHHAHVASAVAEHGLDGPVLGVVFDGAGLGPDDTVWGGEFLMVEGDRFERLAHLACVPLPGGDRAAREPWRMAAAYLRAAYGSLENAPVAVTGANPKTLSALGQMMERGVNAPLTSSAGRLFDAVAALTDVRHTAQFEAQAAMELEYLATGRDPGRYDWDWSDEGDVRVIETGPLIRDVVRDVLRGRTAGEIAASFHHTLARIVIETIETLSRRTGIRNVILTGGVFQNRRLTEDASRGLRSAGVTVFLPRQVPCNDGGLALGQAYVAHCRHGGS